jgi:hypothetical protein
MKKRTTILPLLVLYLVLSTISFPLVNATEDSWATLTPMPTARKGLGVAVVDNKIYAIGGYNGSYLGANEMYDLETDSWTTKTPMPTPRDDFAVAVCQNKIYVIGGSTENDTFTAVNQVYDPSTDTWETKTPMLTPRSGLCASVVDGKIYLLGGGQEYPYPNWGPSSKNEVYDPETDTWTTKNSLPEQVYLTASVVLDEKIHVLGGQFEFLGGGFGDFHQVYDPENDSWTQAEPVPDGFFSAAAGATNGVCAPKRIYVLGGVIWHYSLCNLTQVYNPDQDSWSAGTPMSTARYGFGVAVIDDRMYAIGGFDYEEYRNENEVYTPADYVPEFPSWIILALLFAVAFFVIIVRNRMLRPRSHEF